MRGLQSSNATSHRHSICKQDGGYSLQPTSESSAKAFRVPPDRDGRLFGLQVQPKPQPQEEEEFVDDPDVPPLEYAR